MAYWELRIKGEFDKTYAFEDPVFRKSVSLVDYLKRWNNILQVKKAVLKNMTINNDTAVVDLDATVEAHAPGVKPLVTNVERREKWGKLGGIWYHVVEEQSSRG